jgi:alpha-L-fucosidase
VDIVSKGGNYLLNVGPTAEGEIPAESVKLLKEVGAWMKVNGDSIYGTQASPFRKLAWGRCTMKPAGEDTILYLHVIDWPADGMLTVPGLKNPVKSAEFLTGGPPLVFGNSDNGPVLTLPAAAPDAVCTTIRLLIQGKPEITESPVSPDPDGVIRLLPGDAHFEGEAIKIEEREGQANIGLWTHPGDSVSWNFRVDHDGRYLVRIESASGAEGAVLLVQGIGKMALSVPKTADFNTYQTSPVGEVVLSKGTAVKLTLLPVVDGWHPTNLRKVELIPQP